MLPALKGPIMDTTSSTTLPNDSAQHPDRAPVAAASAAGNSRSPRVGRGRLPQRRVSGDSRPRARNPLSDIVSAVEVLEQQGSRDAVAAEMHGILRRQSLHMTRLIDDLLDVSRISCGKILLQLARIDLAELVSNAVTDHQHHFEAGRLKLVFARPLNPIWVIGDASRLSQVFTNLLHNAIKFTDPGGTVCVGVMRSETSVAVSVRDTGIGMELTELAAMFEPFRQAESSQARSCGGLGLGLALSKGLIEKHEGAITAASEGPGCGSTFSIRLPLDREMSVELSPPAARAVAAPQQRRILIVDDRRDARLTLKVLLERMGQQVAQADSGAGALESARSFHPEVVLCDIGLPDMDGYAVARAIRRPDAPGRPPRGPHRIWPGGRPCAGSRPVSTNT